MTSPIDWNVAEATALRWGSPGPTIDRDEARAVVTELRHAAARAVEPVAEVTGMQCPVDTADTEVVDRARFCGL